MGNLSESTMDLSRSLRQERSDRRAGSEWSTPSKSKAQSLLLNHHLSRLDDCVDRVALLQFHFICATPGDCAVNQVVTHANHNVRHHRSQDHILNGPLQMVSC